MHKNTGGIDVNYIEKGSGEYVFLLHGWGSNCTLFNAAADVISQKYTAVAPDMPGFGQTAEPKEVWGVPEYTDHVIEFIRSFNAKKVILLGHSFGGRVIITMASRTDLPFTIEKIILVDSAGIKPVKTAKQKLRGRIYKAGRTVLTLAPVKKLFPDAFDKYRRKHGSADYNAASEHMKKCLVRTVNEDLTPLLEKITPPTLLIWGSNDTATPLSDGKLMEQKIKGSGLVVLEGAGHYSFLEQPYIFERVIKSFLNI